MTYRNILLACCVLASLILTACGESTVHGDTPGEQFYTGCVDGCFVGYDEAFDGYFPPSPFDPDGLNHYGEGWYYGHRACYWYARDDIAYGYPFDPGYAVGDVCGR